MPEQRSSFQNEFHELGVVGFEFLSTLKAAVEETDDE